MAKTIPSVDSATTEKQLRFWKLLADKEAILEQSAPLRAEYNDLRQQEQVLQARQKVLADQFKAIEAPIYAIDQERAEIVRQLRPEGEYKVFIGPRPK